eukprot:1434676-Rhodomonas_salina.1
MRASGNVRNVPPTCRASTATSPPVRGDFGRTIPYMTAVVASDPSGSDQVALPPRRLRHSVQRSWCRTALSGRRSFDGDGGRCAVCASMRARQWGVCGAEDAGCKARRGFGLRAMRGAWLG